MSINPARLAVGLIVVLIAGYGGYHALQVTGSGPDEQIFREEPEPHYVNLWTGPDGLMVQVLLEGFPHRPSNLTARYLSDDELLSESRNPSYQSSLEDGREHVYRLDLPDRTERVEVRYSLRGQETSLSLSPDGTPLSASSSDS